MLHDTTILRIWKEAIATDSAESFLAMYPVEEAAVPLTRLWNVAHWDFKVLIKEMGFTLLSFSNRFCVPYRTVQDWAAGRRNPPSYVRLWAAESSGYIQIRNTDLTGSWEDVVALPAPK